MYTQRYFPPKIVTSLSYEGPTQSTKLLLGGSYLNRQILLYVDVPERDAHSPSSAPVRSLFVVVVRGGEEKRSLPLVRLISGQSGISVYDFAFPLTVENGLQSMVHCTTFELIAVLKKGTSFQYRSVGHMHANWSESLWAGEGQNALTENARGHMIRTENQTCGGQNGGQNKVRRI